jgi:DNA-binding LacI/PurR family transcriptional regulator
MSSYLWNCGCRRITLLPGSANSPSLPEKRQAAEKIFGRDVEVLALEPDEEQAYKKLNSLLPEDKALLPDAFFCTTQVTSFALLRLANERNWVVPDDFMIMGYSNDMKMRPTIPMLTYVRIPYYEMGKTACRLLADKILNDIQIPEETIIPAELIIGETTK